MVEIFQNIYEQQSICKDAAANCQKNRKSAGANFYQGKVSAFKEAFIIIEDYCIKNNIELPIPLPPKTVNNGF